MYTCMCLAYMYISGKMEVWNDSCNTTRVLACVRMGADLFTFFHLVVMLIHTLTHAHLQHEEYSTVQTLMCYVVSGSPQTITIIDQKINEG